MNSLEIWAGKRKEGTLKERGRTHSKGEKGGREGGREKGREGDGGREGRREEKRAMVLYYCSRHPIYGGAMSEITTLHTPFTASCGLTQQ